MEKQSAKHLLAFASLLVIAGCGASHELETAPVTGMVTLDGTPLTEGAVLFLPLKGRGSTAAIQSDGTYSMITYGSNDGATVGQHRIVVKTLNDTTVTDKDPVPTSTRQNTSVIPIRYQSVKTSGLEFDVKPGVDNVFDIKLTTEAK